MSLPIPSILKDLFYPILKKMSKKVYLFAPAINNPITSIYDIKVNSIDGRETTLSNYKGKKMLIVNTASECGYTHQYVQLQELFMDNEKGIVVLGFPSNDFGGQEPGSEEEILAFCDSKYHVTFPMFSKITVKGDEMHPLYHWLSDPLKNGWNSQATTWNFCKYLVDENGKLLKFFSAAVDPFDHEIIG